MGMSIVKFSKTLVLNSDMGFESIRMKKDESFSNFYDKHGFFKTSLNPNLCKKILSSLPERSKPKFRAIEE